MNHRRHVETVRWPAITANEGSLEQDGRVEAQQPRGKQTPGQNQPLACEEDLGFERPPDRGSPLGGDQNQSPGRPLRAEEVDPLLDSAADVAQRPQVHWIREVDGPLHHGIVQQDRNVGESQASQQESCPAPSKMNAPQDHDGHQVRDPTTYDEDGDEVEGKPVINLILQDGVNSWSACRHVMGEHSGSISSQSEGSQAVFCPGAWVFCSKVHFYAEGAGFAVKRFSQSFDGGDLPVKDPSVIF